jgi:ATP-dependent RNA helicase SUPV3L1/SUV3
MNDLTETLPAENALAEYLVQHQATVVTTEGSYALSVHGELQLDGHVIPYHLVPDDGFLGKGGKWRKLDGDARLALVAERWNEAARERLRGLS